MAYANVSWVDSNMVHTLVARVFRVVVIDIFGGYMVLDDGAYASDVSADIGNILQVGALEVHRYIAEKMTDRVVGMS